MHTEMHAQKFMTQSKTKTLICKDVNWVEVKDAAEFSKVLL